ncbi:MAG: hypothetical protein ACK4ST_08580 [Elioraea tepidiphila]
MTRPAPATAAFGAHLDAAAEAVARDYRAFVEAAPSRAHHEDAKSFAAFHAACRAALVHLQELLKLLKATRPADAAEVEEVASLIARARAVLAAHAEEEPQDHDDPAG